MTTSMENNKGYANGAPMDRGMVEFH